MGGLPISASLCVTISGPSVPCVWIPNHILCTDIWRLLAGGWLCHFPPQGCWIKIVSLRNMESAFRYGVKLGLSGGSLNLGSLVLTMEIGNMSLQPNFFLYDISLGLELV